VTLPSGYPEPDTYPPSAEYLATMEERKKDSHPLWQFFHVTEKSKTVKAGQESPVDFGSVEILAGDEENQRSGE
jgi:large subunit ribosomal protein L47